MLRARELAKLPDAEVDCLRCGQRMKDAGAIRLQEGQRMGFGNTAAMKASRLEFQMNICPKCGKTEFFS